MPEMKCDKCGGELRRLHGYDFYCPVCTPLLPRYHTKQEEPECPACEAGIPTKEMRIVRMTPELALKNELIERQEESARFRELRESDYHDYGRLQSLENQETIMKALRYLLARGDLERKGLV